MREGAEKEQAFVEADELVGIIQRERGELGEEFGDEGGVACVEAILCGFELGEELVGKLGWVWRNGWHRRRDSVTRVGRRVGKSSARTVTRMVVQGGSRKGGLFSKLSGEMERQCGPGLRPAWTAEAAVPRL